MPADRRYLHIDIDEVRWLRADLGPLAWVVLEVLASQVEPGSCSTSVDCSTRSLAELVGVSKDSVARALRRLMSEDLVLRVEHRDFESGRFVGTSYVVDIERAGLQVVAVSQNDDSVPPERTAPPVASVPSGQPDHPGRRVGPGPSDQLSLLT